MPIALRTPRLVLREWRDDDAEPFAAMSSDAEVMRHLVPFADRVEIDAWAARVRVHWRDYGFGPWVVATFPGNAFVGVVGLNQVRWSLPFTPAVEAAWRLARPYWGQGYALEAARAAIDDGFARLGLAEIVAYTVPANRPSWRVMERLGMMRDVEGDFEHPSRPIGHPERRHVLYRLRALR